MYKVLIIHPKDVSSVKRVTNFLKRLGDVNIIHCEKLSDVFNQPKIDLIVLIGGPDYGYNKERDDLEFSILNNFYGKVKIFGICRGFQIINLFLGGGLLDVDKTLINEWHYIKGLNEDVNNGVFLSNKSYYHNVIIDDNFIEKFKLSDFFYSGYKKSFIVNSRHHLILENSLFPSTLNKWCWTDGGVIEGFYNENVLGVQYHPERLEDINESYNEVFLRYSNYLKINFIDLTINVLKSFLSYPNLIHNL